MRLLIDADLPKSIGLELRDRGHDVVDARDLSARALPDQAIYQSALDEGRILITRDLDFSNILQFQPKAPVGIVVLRVRMLSPKEVLTLLEDLLKRFSERQLQGAVTIVQPGRYRRHAM